MEKLKTDFRGLDLCTPCWDTAHKDCMYGECECPCRRLDQNKYDQAAVRRETKIANKKAQMTIDTGDDVIQIGPVHKEVN